MDPIDELMAEHRAIERVLDALVVMADRWYRGGGDHRAALAGYVRFLRDYVDDRHHGKEEDLLFAAMMVHGVPSDRGPVACMLGDHGLGRRLVGALGERAAQATPWDDGDRLEVIRVATAYAALLRGHIAKEDQMLYPLARARVSATSMTAMGAAFVELAPPADDPLATLTVELLAQAQAVVHGAAPPIAAPSP